MLSTRDLRAFSSFMVITLHVSCPLYPYPPCGRVDLEDFLTRVKDVFPKSSGEFSWSKWGVRKQRVDETYVQHTSHLREGVAELPSMYMSKSL